MESKEERQVRRNELYFALILIGLFLVFAGGVLLMLGHALMG